MNSYSLYCLTENGTRVRYFGITRKSHAVRFLEHVSSLKRSGLKTRKCDWMASCLCSGIQVVSVLLRSGLNLKEALRLERVLIRVFAKAFKLVNSAHSSRLQKRHYSKGLLSKPEKRHLGWLRLAQKNGDWFKISILETASHKRRQSTIYRLGGKVRTSDGQSARQFCRGLEQLLTKSA